MFYDIQELDILKDQHVTKFGESIKVLESVVLLVNILRDEEIFNNVKKVKINRGELRIYNHVNLLIGRIYVMKNCNLGYIEYKLHDATSAKLDIPNYRDFFDSCRGLTDESIFKSVIVMLKWKKRDWERRSRNKRRRLYDPA